MFDYLCVCVCARASVSVNVRVAWYLHADKQFYFNSSIQSHNRMYGLLKSKIQRNKNNYKNERKNKWALLDLI